MFTSANVTVTVADLKKTVQFYTETLGLKLQGEMDDHFVQIEAPRLTIGLLHLTGERNAQSAKSESMSIGFVVQDLEAAIKTLKSHGVKFHDYVEGKAAQVVHFNDPDGNTLYLVSDH
ncbi:MULTISPECIES: VOC family protein [Heyndrickxia]|uniref:VOC family protein n=2 Tax=Bacillaceae TaxID=186817 RepID=A0AAU7WD68_9BACI|nr:MULTISPECIES: VOC family protein [Heyndrickxia]AVD55983.1 glyoxalase/bleomycin resistance/dioxygenase family protein [Heyndrickxia coagulans]KYC59087.1 hypothetical protein B4100_3588 [Heyndrickxia coagulans]MEC2304600.1 VOC family protein [Weizmannia sp. CD-2023]MEC2339715.1 VOC family protein [Weizmannia sp. CD-2023]